MPNQSYLIFSTRITEAYPKLSPMEKQLADYMLENPQLLSEATIRSVADAAGVSTATVVRFCRVCGFSGFTDLKLCIGREYAISRDADKAQKYTDVKKSDSVAMVRKKVLGYHNMIVNDMLSGWNEDAYTLATEALLKANRILIFGEGGSRSSVLCLFHILSNLGLNCETYMDSVFEIMKVGTVREGDVVIGITYTGRLRNTVESLKLAKERGATTIGLVGYLHSPVMKYVDIVLNTTKLTKDYYDSALSIRVSEMLIIEILAMLLAVNLHKTIEPTTARDHVISIRRIWEE